MRTAFFAGGPLRSATSNAVKARVSTVALVR